LIRTRTVLGKQGNLCLTHLVNQTFISLNDNGEALQRIQVAIYIVYRESHHELHDEIIKQIRRYYKENGSYEGLLVTYRFYVEASYLMYALDAARIPYRVFGDRSRRDRPIVNFIFALINIVENGSKEEKDWKPVITSFSGIGEAKWKRVFEWMKNGGGDCPKGCACCF